MLFLMLLLSTASINTAQADCMPYIRMSTSQSHVCLGHSFKLSCMFSCLSDGQNIEMKNPSQVITRLYLSQTSLGSKTNGSLVLFVHSASKENSGMYTCVSSPGYGRSHLNINVTACPNPDVPAITATTASTLSHSNSTQSAESLENTLMWYLLCKTGVFLLCSMSVALKTKNHIC